MSAPDVLARARPEEVRAVADRLRAAGVELHRLSTEVRTAGAAGPSWVGLAALEQSARADATGRLVASLAAPGDRVAEVLCGVADVTEATRREVERWRRRADEVAEELARLRAAPTADPWLLPLITARTEALEIELVRAGERVRQAGEDLERALAVAARTLREIVAPLRTALEHLVTLVRAGTKLSGVRRPVARAGVAVAGLTTLARARWARDTGVREAARERLRRTPAGWAGARQGRSAGRFVPRRLHGPVALMGRLSPVWTWFGALSDLRDGGGYEGWRGTVTRTVAGGAVLGVPAMALATVLPPVALAGAVGVGAYTAWTTGSWLYDHRAAIGRAAGATWSRARSVGAGTGRWVGRAGDAALRRARSRASLGLQRLTEAGRRLTGGGTRRGVVVGRRASRVDQVRRSAVEDLPLGSGRRSPVLVPGWSW